MSPGPDEHDTVNRCPSCDQPLSKEKLDEIAQHEAAKTEELARDFKEEMASALARARTGRPPKPPAPGERMSLGLKVTADIKSRLDRAAHESGRTQSQEAEMRIERSFDRQDLLSEVLTLAYGREAAGLLMMLGLAMVRAGEFTHVESGAAADGIVSWTDNAAAFGNVTNAVLALLDAAKPEETSYSPRPGIGLRCAEELIETMRDPTARSWFAAHSRTAVTIRSLLGPVVDRMIKAAETRPIVGLEPREQARQALVSDIANVLSALVVSKIRLHEVGHANSPAPSREEIFEVLEKRFPVEQRTPADPAKEAPPDVAPPTKASRATTAARKVRLAHMAEVREIRARFQDVERSVPPAHVTGKLKITKPRGAHRKVQKP